LPGGSSWRKSTDLVRFAALSACFALAAGTGLGAQPQTPAATPAEQRTITAAIQAEPSAETYLLTYFNRPIVELRARVLGRRPEERAFNAVRSLDDLIDRGTTEPVEARVLDEAALLVVAGRTVLALTPADADELSGETLSQAAAAAADRLRQALAEAHEARTPGRLLRSTAVSVTAIIAGVLLLMAVARVQRMAASRLITLSEKSATKTGIDVHLFRASRLVEFQRRLISGIATALYLMIGYTFITFVLRQFPFTRPWGEAMRGFLLDKVSGIGLAVAYAIPGLVTVVVILLLTRFIVRLIGLWFVAIERGRVMAPRWIHPETAQPTRRLLTAAAWLFALVLVYPYVPGSQTDAFKGVSVLLGLMVTIGSSGLMTQVMSSFMITYSRALRVGDFVRIGEVEGTVTQLGMLSTKIQTVWSEEVTIPNALVISQTTTDYSRLPEGVLTPTSVTIGYDAPWRQVHSLLLTAAEQTPGLRREVKPVVIQSALQDFYVQYTLLVPLERQDARLITMAALHANIQDLFNQYGVQIMSPHYMVDPAVPKIVPKQQWFAAPARPESISTR
jgi:small-conductance mechanosensitive channel